MSEKYMYLSACVLGGLALIAFAGYIAKGLINHYHSKRKQDFENLLKGE